MPTKKTKSVAKVRLKIEVNGVSIGPGKIALLQHIRDEGSISAAGRAMGMDYRRAWHLLKTLQDAFEETVIDTKTGGKDKGGAVLTSFGEELISQYNSALKSAEHGASELLVFLSGGHS